jgi:HK97 family phage portal protein
VKIRERLAKMFFPDVIKNEIQKSSKQVISHVLGLTANEGVLPDVDFEIFNQMYEQTSWVRAVVGVICKAVTARGYSLVPAKPNPDQRNAELLSEFFSNCNPNDTFLEILDDITRDDYVFGNAFLEVVNGADGKPKELWNLDATTIRVKADDHGLIEGYVQLPRFASAGTRSGRVDFESNEVIHFKLGTKGATLYGLSPLTSLILPVTVDKFAQIYNRAFFINGGKIRGAFIMKNSTAEQVERNREYLQARAKNPDMAHSDLVMEGEIEYKQIGVNQKDMEFLELREFTRNEILAVYGVPPSKVSIIETGNIGAGTGEHQTQTFYEETILPYQMRLAEKITKHIIQQGFGITDWSFQFNKRSIDEKAQAEIFNIYLQNGVFTPDEVRRIVAPRMPEVQKGFVEIKKGGLTQQDVITESTRAIVALENRFVNALNNLFRKIKSTISAKIARIARDRVVPKVQKLQGEVELVTVRFHSIVFKQYRFLDAMKQLDDLEAILELIDQNKIAQLVERFSLEAALKGLKLSARRSNLDNVDDLSNGLEEYLKNNALDLAGHISESIKSGLRQTLIDGLAADETFSQLQSRIESQLDSFATVEVKSVLDEEGNVIREGHTRSLSRSSAVEIIARTEANRAFNEGNLDAFKQADIAQVQFLLAPDACPQCRDAADAEEGKFGKTFSIEEASGVIPVHPNCRCTWITEVG